MSLKPFTIGKCPDCVYNLVINGYAPRCLKCIKGIDDTHFSPKHNPKLEKSKEREAVNRFYEALDTWSKGNVR
jgi:hypothetical protein